MKKLVYVLLLVALLMPSTATVASAGAGFEDPAVCIAGQWLQIWAPLGALIQLVVPKGMLGGCSDPAPAPLLDASAIKQAGNGDEFKVQVGAECATLSYGGESQTNCSKKGKLKFEFDLEHEDD